LVEILSKGERDDYIYDNDGTLYILSFLLPWTKRQNFEMVVAVDSENIWHIKFERTLYSDGTVCWKYCGDKKYNPDIINIFNNRKKRRETRKSDRKMLVDKGVIV